MSEEKKRVAAMDGWFSMDAHAPHLLGNRCTTCRSYFFPKASLLCRNPGCAGTEFEEVPLSRTGTLWSYTTNFYQPPEPYVSPKPFVPYSVAAVELAAEKIVVLGQIANGVDPATVKVGTKMDLVLETLYADDAAEYVVWKWKPAA